MEVVVEQNDRSRLTRDADDAVPPGGAMTVDPHVHELASAFVDDLLAENLGELLKRQESLGDAEVYALLRTGLVERAAAAMQRAIEDELEAIRQELLP